MPDEETQHQYYIHRSIPLSFSSWNYSSLLYETELTTSTNKKIKKKSEEIENSKNEIHFSCIRYVREKERERTWTGMGVEANDIDAVVNGGSTRKRCRKKRRNDRRSSNSHFFFHFDPKFQKFLIQNQIKLQRRCCRYSVTNKVEKVMAGWWRAQNNTSHVTKKIRTMPGIDVYV